MIAVYDIHTHHSVVVNRPLLECLAVTRWHCDSLGGSTHTTDIQSADSGCSFKHDCAPCTKTTQRCSRLKPESIHINKGFHTYVKVDITYMIRHKKLQPPPISSYTMQYII